MISIQLSRKDFIYDIQALCKAFYPNESIQFEILEEAKTEWDDCQENLGQEKQLGLCLKIYLGENEIQAFAWGDNNFYLEKKEKSEGTDRKINKNILKKIVYYILSERTKKTLPWGTLTGVRPSKIAMERLELGENEEEISSFMKSQYLCVDQKIKLAVSIAKKELGILQEMDYKNGYSVYIGIPFCPSRCLYCSFTSYSLEQYKNDVDAYLKALFQEIEYGAKCLPQKKLHTIYIGGGTPTTLSAEQLEALIIKIKTSFSMVSVKEFTVEAGRPDSITREKLKVLKEQGVTRISINPQTMNQCTLDYIGRRHSVEEVVEAFQVARETGHTNINMDLIAGLPGESMEDMSKTLQQVGALEPEGITVHSLVVKRAADLNLYTGQEKSKQLYDTQAMLDLSGEFTEKKGYAPYYMYRQKNATGNTILNQENIGYAKPGKEGIYNILIMEEKQTILALGAGGASKFVFTDGSGIVRVENVKSVKDYIERIDEMITRKKSFFQKNKEFY